ncbi:MAG: tRNA 2-thiouridine(34) synthase MnmA, partial [Actinomycetota bacterium]
VIDGFVREHARGRTPNPCVECNRSVKFSMLLERAKAFGATVLATGHYARVTGPPGDRRLLRGLDRDKDQSYVLYMLGQGELGRAHFPVGEYRKDEVRQIASSLDLRTAAKPESQEICFVPNGDVHSFVAAAVPAGSRSGPVVNSEGDLVGAHRGFAHYTIGQRRGLGVSAGIPLYVSEVRAADNTVVVDTLDRLVMNEIVLEKTSFVAGQVDGSLSASVMTRYRGPEAPAEIEPIDGRWRIVFTSPQPRAAPGQAAVFYRGEEVLGGGTISEVR